MGRRRKAQIGEVTDTYTEVCWKHHEKVCVVCGEYRVVAAHHHNGYHWDNRPENLVPLCPTHHTYWHSKHKYLIEDVINEYVLRFTENGSKFDDPFRED